MTNQNGRTESPSRIGRSAASAIRGARRALTSIWAPIVAKLVLLILAFCGIGWLGTDEMRSRVLAPSTAALAASPTAIAAHVAAAPPRLGRPPEPSGATEAGCATPACDQAATPGLTADGRVILNEAGASVLTRLPGVGDARAAAILELRSAIGRFRRVEDLLRVRGIGRKSLERMRPMVVVDPPTLPDDEPTEDEPTEDASADDESADGEPGEQAHE